ncbi:MraY family glycosyltransferase [Thermomonas carbonis]|uniref:Glycosyltransferase family 4 protein n=1 Tax=Thermomonas carbonis TaxID=1463158 RepID=A0A7G9SP86_9GAMM|nr:glycosyltransferase family 4 protein [Thermomonas carbonis]QNN69661.1 glycosyltransferase family 4 protein [Thermomonas carbonis]GHB94620.1 LPS biosynthesis protein [Thermomonas carbonis]
MPWSEPALLAASAIAALVISMAGTAWAITYARRRGMLDQPGERRSHATATPRGGGVGIVLVLLLAMILLGWGVDAGWWPVAAGLLLVAGIGWGDDHYPLPSALRLGVHAIAGLALAWGLHLQDAGVPALLAALVLVPVLVNAWNFMDGIDGLAASQALLCGVGLACLLDVGWQVAGIALTAACLGFLPFNRPPARIFLGDVGSGALGYAIAALLAGGVATLPSSSWLLLALPPMAMLGDSGLTLGWRIATGQRWWQAHVQHLYQRCSRRWGHLQVSTAYALWTCVAIGIMLRAHDTRMPAAPVVAMMATIWLLAWAWMHRRSATTTEGFGR